MWSDRLMRRSLIENILFLSRFRRWNVIEENYMLCALLTQMLASEVTVSSLGHVPYSGRHVQQVERVTASFLSL